MKHPWVPFTGICALVLAIVVFCVVFGGYSSLLRSQNRIHAVKDQLVSQTREQLGFAREWIRSRDTPLSPETRQDLSESTKAMVHIIGALEAVEDLPPAGLFPDYERVQARLNRILAVAADCRAPQTTVVQGKTDPLKSPSVYNRCRTLQTAVFVTGRRYNKEVRYFNTRTSVFPGFMIARLFDLDKFPEIDIRSLAPIPEQEAPNAS